MEKERAPDRAYHGIKEVDWAAIRAEYITTKVTQKELAEKYEVSLRALREQSANGKWSEKRREMQQKKADKIAEALNDRSVKQTVRDIEKVCKLARKMIEKVNRAINQVDKVTYISLDEKEIEQSTKPKTTDPEVEVTKITQKRKMKLSKAEGKASAKELAELSKTLLNLKQVLTVDDGGGSDEGAGGVIEIVPMNEVEYEEVNEDEKSDMEAAG